jgi:hypothetical protein
MRWSSTALGASAFVLSAALVAAQPAKGPSYPGVGDLMNTLIQPRHAKLGLAGREQNWPLAAYAIHELKLSFDNIGKLQKNWRGLSLPDMFDSTVGEPLHGVFLAIQARDAQKCAAGYERLTAACNNCHEAVNHPFIVIKAPDRSEFPNQEFAPKKP